MKKQKTEVIPGGEVMHIYVDPELKDQYGEPIRHRVLKPIEVREMKGVSRAAVNQYQNHLSTVTDNRKNIWLIVDDLLIDYLENK